MAHDDARAVPQPVVEPAAHDTVLPVPRSPVRESGVHDVARPVRRSPVPEPAVDDAARPASRPVHGIRIGWILTSVVAAAVAWAVGWITGASWAWRELRFGYWGRNHRRRAGRPRITR